MVAGSNPAGRILFKTMNGALLENSYNVLSVIRKLAELHFPIMLGVVILGVLVLSGIVIFVTHLWRGKNPKPISEGASLGNDMNSVIYGLILAFLVVSMYDTNQKVEQSINDEANALVGILYSSRIFDNANEIKAQVQNYTKIVTEEQWPLMKLGSMKEAWAILPKVMQPLYKVVQEAHPVGDVQLNFYNAMPNLLHDLDIAHRSRLAQADMHLPIQFWRIIFLMTILSLGFLCYMNPWTGIASAIPIIIPSIVVGLCFSLLISLHYPFIGPFSVSIDSYKKGELSSLKIEDSTTLQKLPVITSSQSSQEGYEKSHSNHSSTRKKIIGMPTFRR